MFKTLAWMAAFVVGTASAHADIIRMKMTGPINDTNFPEFPLGQPLSLTLDYDSATPEAATSPGHALYINAIVSFTLTTVSYTWSATGHFGQVAVQHQDINSGGFDDIEFTIASGDYPPYGGVSYLANPVPLAPVESILGEKPIDFLGFAMGSLDGQALPDTSLPTHYSTNFMLPLDYISLQTTDYSGFSTQFSTWSAVDLTTIPEPATLAILLTGATFLMRRRALIQR